MLSCEISEIYKNIFFEEKLWTIASNLLRDKPEIISLRKIP